MTTDGPTTLRKRLGADLRKLRERADMDQSQAATHLDCAVSKISRIEQGHGKSVVRERDVLDLLELYGVTDMDVRKQMLEIRRLASSPGWWEQSDVERALPVDLGPYVGLEADARKVQAWESTYVPGLLQITEYARAVLSSGGDRSAKEVDHLVAVREKRQHRLNDAGFELWAVVDESALRRPVGGPEVMRAQINHLRATSDRANVTVQIIPISKGAHPGMRGSFTLLEFGAGDPKIAYVDGMGGNLLMEKEAQVRPLAQVFDRLMAVALDPTESAALLSHLAAKEPTP
ncbi:helix-turn-helix domain-containing protein [Streptomyces sp. NRRL F-525]|uniref:helix-turn-helix domain-containing protein n=1 Tax=Streptomyces sp. NRRL F-525 TaxID=1463861 RepID=UPI000526C2DB|nr:helix-turn-helix transcriptional regulator [Streptomyces sp. NRRL F-525]